MLKIYTDGSAKANGSPDSPGGFGVVVMDGNTVVDCYAHHEIGTTNNAQEMKAILWAYANYGNENGFNLPIVYSDSAYAINSFTQWKNSWKARGWTRPGGKPVENLELVKAYDALEQMGLQIDLIKVKGHNGVLGNELADDLAAGRISCEEVMKNYGLKGETNG